MSRREPPHAQDAEIAILGAWLCNPAFLDVLEEKNIQLQARHFFSERSRTLFLQMARMRAAGEEWDPVVIAQKLQERGKLQEDNPSGGSLSKEFIAELADVGGVSHNAAAYAELIINTANLRWLREASGAMNEIATSLPEGRTAMQIAEEMMLKWAETEQRIFENEDQAQGAGDIANDYFNDYIVNKDKLEAQRRRMRLQFVNPKNPKAGYNQLNEATMGMGGGEFYILAARPGMGKTTLALNIILQIMHPIEYKITDAASGDEKTVRELPAVYFASMEMDKEDIIIKMLSYQTKINSKKFYKSDFEKQELLAVAGAVKALEPIPLTIDDRSHLNINQLTAAVLREQRKRRTTASPLGLVVVDYLQLMDGIEPKNIGNRHLEVANISKGLKLLAKRVNVPVLAMCQVSRNVDKRMGGDLQLGDLRESGNIEQDADVVLGLQDDSNAAAAVSPMRNVELALLKVRRGEKTKIKFRYNPTVNNFAEKAEEF